MYDVNGNRFRKQEGSVDEVYVLGMNGETEAVFNVDGSIKFFNINAGSETIGRFAPTPVDLYLSNTTLTGTYEAQNSITVESNVTVSGIATLIAGNNIILKPGFTAGSGSNFTAKIGSVSNVAKRFYYLKDHLGSIRVVVDEAGEIVNSDDYDPWGMILNGRTTNDAYLYAKYKFTGKERDVETGYDYFGARYYDSRIGRWLVVDPLFEKYPGWSPYNYTLNSPLIYIDPDGRFSWLVALRAKELITGGLVLTGAVLSAVGLEETGKSINSAADWVNNLIPEINFTPTPTPFPITQGEGINQTTIAPSDAIKIPINFETDIKTVGSQIEVKLSGGTKGKVGVHINTDAGNVHIQPLGKGQTHHRGVIIDPSKPLTGQIKELVKGPKSAIQKVEEQVQKALEQLKELEGE